MKLALIPPPELGGMCWRTNYQLMLPQVAKEYPAYGINYGALCKDPDQYVILDNGAAEGVAFLPSELMHMAKVFGVDEVVLPDCIGDSERTRTYALEHFERFGVFKYMYVVQGSNYEEFQKSMQWALKESFIYSIGIPRHMIETCDDKNARMRLARYAELAGYPKPIHFLGASPSHPHELAELARRELSNVRGMDTSLPFNMAYYGVDILSEEEIKRPPMYFDLPAEQFDEKLVIHNVGTVLSWIEA